MVRNYIVCFSYMFLLVLKGFAQTADTSAKLKITGYIDAYYAYYTDSVGPGEFQKFPTISPRSNQFGLNTAVISFQYDAEKVRGILTLHFGDLAKSAWSPTYNNIIEAHAGIRLNKTLWIDAGLFRTHFGTEGLLPKENFCSSISVNTVFEPFYEAGIRLNYNPTDKLSIGVYALNGYNTFEDNNDKKSLGMLVTYALGEKGDLGNIGYSNYIGDDSRKGDPTSHLRIHQNVFLNYQIKKLKMQIGMDYCLQEHSELKDSTATASMISGILGLKYQLDEKYAVYGRGEFFNDPQGFMSGIFTDSENNKTGFKLFGGTLGVEYKPTENSFIRLEGRELQMDKNQKIFNWNSKGQSNRFEIMMNIGISF